MKFQNLVAGVLRAMVIIALLCGVGENTDSALASAGPSIKLGGRTVTVALMAASSMALFGRRSRRRLSLSGRL